MLFTVFMQICGIKSYIKDHFIGLKGVTLISGVDAYSRGIHLKILPTMIMCQGWTIIRGGAYSRCIYVKIKYILRKINNVTSISAMCRTENTKICVKMYAILM